MPENSNAATAVFVSIGRHPVFDTRRRIWGYALFCLGDDADSLAGFPEGDAAAINIAASADIGLQQIVERDKKVLLKFGHKTILDRLPYALPPKLTIVQVTEQVFLQPGLPNILQQLKRDGYEIAVEAFSGNPDCDPLYDMAAVIGIDVLRESSEALAALAAHAGTFDALLLAMQVQDSDRLSNCMAMGFDLFQGAFFKNLDVFQTRQLTSNEMAHFKLLHLLEQDNVDFDQLAETIQADVSISFRLLSYINSAAFGFAQKIKSIHQAVAMLGWRKIKKWLRVVLLSDMNQNKSAPEVMRLAVQRGKFLELVAQSHDFWGFDPESLHLLGLFSLLDTMLGISMPEIVAHLPLAEKLKAALCREANNEYLPLLELAQNFEEARWDECKTMMQRLNLDSAKVRHAFQEAIAWSDEMVSLHAGTE